MRSFYTHTNTHTHTHIHKGTILRNQVNAGLQPVHAWFNKSSKNLFQYTNAKTFMSSTTKESHISDISHKVYMSKTVICCTCTSTVIIVFYLCMVIMCTGASGMKNVAIQHNSFIYPFCMATLFLVQRISYQLQYKSSWSRGCSHVPMYQ